MTKLSTRQLLIGTFVVLAFLVTLVSLLAMRSLSASDERFSGYVHGLGARQGLLSDLRSAANRRAIGVRDMALVATSGERDIAKAMAVGANEELHAGLRDLKALIDADNDVSEREHALFQKIERIEAQYEPVALSIVELAATGKRDLAIEKINSTCRPLLSDLLATIRESVEVNRQESKAEVESSAATYASQRNVLLALAAFAVLSAIALGLFVTRRILGALGAEPADLSVAARHIADGDLREIAGAAQAAPGSVLASMGLMQHQLVELIGQVRASADSIATASAQISQGNNDLSSRTESQASALEETAASMEELNSTVKQNAHNAGEANDLAHGASAVATRGGEVVLQVVETMKGINDSSRRIADIIGVIDGIAFQTNILALNAAVEAARAGEQGRGFAVVAAEVRNLAQRSAAAAKEIKTLIGDSVEKVERGSKLVGQAGVTMDEVVASVKRVTDIMSEIANASVEQSAGIEQVNRSIIEMDSMTQQNAALVEQAAAAAQSLQDQASELANVVSIFKLVEGGAAYVAAAAAAAAAASAAPARPAPLRVASAVLKNPVLKKPVPTASTSKKVVATTNCDEWEEF